MKTGYSLLAIGGNKTKERDENDFYATQPEAVDVLVKAERLSNNVWECACGNGNLAERFKELGYGVRCSDLIVRDYDCEQLDFLGCTKESPIDIVTNPPFKDAERFIRHGWSLLEEGRKLCLFLKLSFLESVRRDVLFEKYPPVRIHVCRKRIKCAKQSDFSAVKSSPTCYAWFVWEKGTLNTQTIIDRV